tara:strand:- start:15 stop:338 length:324 start_codon:yes stop_codon:yes gene_type:complete
MTDNYDDRKFDEAMRTQMRQQLGESICTVKFKKADDTEREMKCTTNDRFIPEEKLPKSDKTNNDMDLFVVFDTDKNEWRSFKYERMLSFYYPGTAKTNNPPVKRIFP